MCIFSKIVFFYFIFSMSPRDAAIILETEMAVEVKAFEMTAKSLQIRDKPHKTRDLNDQHNVKKFRSSSSLVAARKEYSRKLRRLLLEKDRILYDLELKQICQESEDTTIPDSFTEAEEEKGNGKQEEAEEKDVADSFGKMQINWRFNKETFYHINASISCTYYVQIGLNNTEINNVTANFNFPYHLGLLVHIL